MASSAHSTRSGGQARRVCSPRRSSAVRASSVQSAPVECAVRVRGGGSGRGAPPVGRLAPRGQDCQLVLDRLTPSAGRTRQAPRPHRGARRRCGRRCHRRAGPATDSLGCGGSGCVCRVPVQDRGGALGGSGESHACCAHTTRSAGRGPVPHRPALAEQYAQRGRLEGDELGEASGDLSGHATLLGLLRQRCTGGVDDADQREVQLARQRHPHAAPRGARRTTASSVWPRRSWPSTMHGAAPNRARR